jgi:hypothetical protein
MVKRYGFKSRPSLSSLLSIDVKRFSVTHRVQPPRRQFSVGILAAWSTVKKSTGAFFG